MSPPTAEPLFRAILLLGSCSYRIAQLALNVQPGLQPNLGAFPLSIDLYPFKPHSTSNSPRHSMHSPNDYCPCQSVYSSRSDASKLIQASLFEAKLDDGLCNGPQTMQRLDDILSAVAEQTLASNFVEAAHVNAAFEKLSECDLNLHRHLAHPIDIDTAAFSSNLVTMTLHLPNCIQLCCHHCHPCQHRPLV